MSIYKIKPLIYTAILRLNIFFVFFCVKKKNICPILSTNSFLSRCFCFIWKLDLKIAKTILVLDAYIL